MKFIQTYIQRISTHLQLQGFLFDAPPDLNDTPALLYARSRRPYPVPFARVVDHFLFLDWEEHLSASKDRLTATYSLFNRQVNRQFKVPHMFRLTIPGMAVIALSNSGFDSTTSNFAQTTYEVPFKGGEVGQYLLVDLANKEVIYHRGHVFKQSGESPLRAAQYVLVPILEDCLRDDYVVPWKRPAGETFPVNPYR
jgi:hypothetical protein